MPWRPTLAPQVLGRPILVAVLLALTLATGFVPLRSAMPVAAAEAPAIEAELLGWINADRAALGLVPFRAQTGLAALAGERAAAMAASGTMSHTVGGCLHCQLTARGIQWYGDGEDIGRTNYPWGDAAARSLYGAWKASPAHWTLLTSTGFNYAGVGLVFDPATASTYASIVMTESIDQTRPWARMVSRSVSGTTVRWSWRGADVPLQSHTAGLRSFDVQYRVDGGAWTTIRSGTTATALGLSGRARGHWYGLRVRSRDGRGYLSPFTAELRVWVP